MTKLMTNEFFKLDKKLYEDFFKNKEFGFDIATSLAHQHGYNFLLERKIEGSNLVFTLGDEYFLKITPPFFGDSAEAEVGASKAIGDQLSFSIPTILADGIVEGWRYIITKKVLGVQAKDVFRNLSQDHKLIFASDIGKVIKAFDNIETKYFERSFGPWNNYLANRLKNQKNIHLEKGNSIEWTEKICRFIEKNTKELLDLAPAKLIHADLNHEHLMLNQINDVWRITGILDFADAMNAPIEMEFILPIICFFKGNVSLQQKIWEKSECNFKFNSKNYSNVMMALTLQNRFIAFHDWFDREIEKGADSVEEIALTIFPQI